MQQPKMNVTAAAYPRTGKRGVPQQFPRRLYEMLDVESTSASADPSISHANHKVHLISWSDTGRAFRIFDVNLFAERILPKYFRTAKFSSFQRNLNLYGFSKVRKGPDTDMYAHPSFQRGHPENLGLLRKLATAADRRRAAEKLAQKLVQQQEEAEANGAKTEASTLTSNVVAGAGGVSIVFPPQSLPLWTESCSSTPTCTGGVVTDYSSSYSPAASVCSAASTFAPSSYNKVEEVAKSAYNISIPKLIETYQKSVEIKPATKTAGCSPDKIIEKDHTTHRRQDASSKSSSIDSMEGNKLALLAMAMTTMAGEEMSITQV